MNVTEKIKKLQYERSWTDYKLAQEAGISQSSLATIFARETPPKLEMLQCICDAFGITLAQFFLEDEGVEIITDKEKRLISAYRSLSTDKQQALLTLIENS